MPTHTVSRLTVFGLPCRLTVFDFGLDSHRHQAHYVWSPCLYSRLQSEARRGRAESPARLSRSGEDVEGLVSWFVCLMLHCLFGMLSFGVRIHTHTRTLCTIYCIAHGRGASAAYMSRSTRAYGEEGGKAGGRRRGMEGKNKRRRGRKRRGRRRRS